MYQVNSLYLIASLLGLSYIFKWIFERIALSKPNTCIATSYTEFSKRFQVVILGLIFLLLINIAGGYLALILSLILSFICFREFVSTIELKGSDYWPLLFTFYIAIPLQYFLVALHVSFLFLIFLPVYAFLLGPMLATLGNDNDRFLERAAKYHWAQLICVYCISYLPAIGLIPLIENKHSATGLTSLIHLALMIWVSDLSQFVLNGLIGKKPLAPQIAPRKTWEGTVVGMVVGVLFGSATYQLTPMPFIGAVLLSICICSIGLLGSLIMSSVKRSLKIKVWSDLLPGHGGFLDRFDSLIFAAPIYYHILQQFYLKT